MFESTEVPQYGVEPPCPTRTVLALSFYEVAQKNILRSYNPIVITTDEDACC